MPGLHPRRRVDIRFEHMPDGSAVLFDPTNSMTYAITASAAQIWEACDGSRPPDAIEADLADTYDAPRDVIGRDVEALLKHFGELGLLEPDGGSSE
jgi:hypothetical protein